MSYPVISIIIPTFNEEHTLERCLNSIYSQDYPKGCIEVIVVDNFSTDATVAIAKKFPVNIISNKIQHGEISKMIGFRKAQGDYAMYLDADIHLRNNDWLKQMVRPLLENSSLIGSFTRYYSDIHSKPIERYLNLDPLQRDSLYQYLSPSFESVLCKRTQHYDICRYTQGNILPAGLCLFRRKELLNITNQYESFLELDFLVLLVSHGFTDFAYVPQSGLYHHHADSLIHLVKKRIYNLTHVYFARSKPLYQWINLKSVSGLIKMFLWVMYVNLIFPSVFVGFFKLIRYKSIISLYEPLVNIAITDGLIISYIYSFVYSEKGHVLD